jgi:lipid II:glycine glycyltransferase (peptidoglycan interpeptide bridge formation enzyme)
MRDSLSAFLHTDAWARVIGGSLDSQSGIVWKKKQLPYGIGSYLLASRIPIAQDFTFPPTTGEWFIRFQADSLRANERLLEQIKGSRLVETPSVQPKETVYLNLEHTADTLRAAMKPKHRYNISLAQKHGVTCEIVTTNTVDHLDRFLALLSSSADRHKITTHPPEHYKRILQEHPTTCFLAFAQYEMHDIAAVMVLVHNNEVATYLHGGSHYDYREHMGPYLLHWEVIRHLQSKKVSLYDLWGVHTKDGKPIDNHPSAGTTRFKLGFGGTHVLYPPMYDLVRKPIPYTIYFSLRALFTRKKAFS